MKFVGALMGKRPEQEIVLRGFLGIGLEEKGDDVVVTGVLPKSPASDSGLKVGDRINKFQGRSVSSIAAVHRAAAKLAAEETARFEIERDGKVQTIKIKAGRGL